MRRFLFCVLMAIVAMGGVSARKLISWNIQDGMWSDQANNYDNFVEFRKKEVEYVCKNTILTSEHPENELWLMMGDFNSISSLDNDHYKLSADSSIYCVHDYIRNNTPYIDVIANKHPGEFIQSSQNGRRIDFIYATEPVINMIRKAEILNSGYTEQHREQGAQYWTPSDHRPILIEF